MSRFQMTCCLATLLFVAATAHINPTKADEVKPSPQLTTPKVQLAILLDTSGSMEGLINQARTQLWKIVNELATAKQGAVTPQLQVALFEYGKSSLAPEEGFLRLIVPFSDDLDKISEELFALETNGGQEFCGHVIGAAVQELSWSDQEKDLKMIFIAGNEPFTQGTVDYKKSCQTAIDRGITVNTIFCGPFEEGVNTKWQDGALMADGSYVNIDQNEQVAVIKTPYDDKLAKLSAEINLTYVAYGREDRRRAYSNRQEAQDNVALEAAPAAAAERAIFKASGQYKASEWDLVGAVANGKVKLADVKKEHLPDDLKKLNLADQQKLVADKFAKRGKIQKQIQELDKLRKSFVAEEQKRLSEKSATETLDTAVISVIRKQANQKEFRFEQE